MIDQELVKAKNMLQHVASRLDMGLAILENLARPHLAKDGDKRNVDQIASSMRDDLANVRQLCEEVETRSAAMSK